MSKNEGKHEDLLAKIKPYPFYPCSNKTEKVYIKIVDIPQDNIQDIEDYTIHISLINENMLEYDEQFFSQEYSEKKYYRPYFYEFYTKPKCVDESVIQFLMEHQDKWMTAEIYDDHKLHNKRIYHNIPGYVFFSASPFKTQGVTLVIIDNTVPNKVKSIDKTIYDTSSAVVLENSNKYEEMKTIIDENIECSNFIIKIYNVGQGNCVYIYTNEGCRILFDIGYNKRPNSPDWKDKLINKSKHSINHMKPHLNILSHWDMDHIIGIAFAQDDMFRHPWIAPNLYKLPNISIGAARLAKYLCWAKNLYLIDSSFLGESVYSSDKFNLWRGGLTP